MTKTSTLHYSKSEKSEKNYSAKTPAGRAARGRQRAEESAYTAPSGMSVCVWAFVIFRTERVYQMQWAGRIFSSTNLDFNRWSVPAENPARIAAPALPALPGHLPQKRNVDCLFRRGQQFLHPQGVSQINSTCCRLNKRLFMPPTARGL